MNSPARRLTLLLTLVAALLAVLPAAVQASPDGDDDPTYNAGSVFGTQYSQVDGSRREGSLAGAKPVTDQAPDGSSVTAVLMNSEGPYLRLTRFDANGQPAGFISGDGTSEQNLDSELYYQELLDLRVLDDGSFVVLLRAAFDNEQPGERLAIVHYGADGEQLADSFPGRPEPCELPENNDRITVAGVRGYVDAARVNADGAVSALWDCIALNGQNGGSFTRAFEEEGYGVFVAQYAAETYEETDAEEIGGDYGEDLELGPNGDPYALVGESDEWAPPRVAENGVSQVFHVALSGADLGPQNGSIDIAGLPVDLAVDSQARAVVWTQPENLTRVDDGNSHWNIWRLIPDLTQLDSSWGSAGQVVISDPRLAPAFGGSLQDLPKRDFLTVRPGDKVLATGGYQPQSPPPPPPPRSSNSQFNRMIVGLTNAGQIDTGFATGGFKEFSYTSGNSEFQRVGEPTLQSDGKVLVPHTNQGVAGRASLRIASPPDSSQYVGVTRLVGANPSAGPSSAVSPSLVRPSATPTICGRRAISLVRADVRGNKIKLTGLVGSKLFGKKVTIQTDPKGARSSKFTKTATVTASRTGSFTASVPKPKRSDFVSVRYRAVSGSAKSPSLKLPQSLTSRSVKSAKNTITVKGRVKKAVLGKRNKVLIRRLVCGRYRTVGTAKPDTNGNYTVTFASTQIRGVAFYRAESKVLRKRGSKKYVIQYARAIAIRTTSQTG